jgi:hypothetical protein
MRKQEVLAGKWARPVTSPRASARRRRRQRVRAAEVVIAAALPALFAFWAFAQPPAPDPYPGVPDFARKDPQVAAAYHFAMSEDGAILQQMACYCGCGPHSGHDSNLACFIKRDGGGFDEHGANCGVCVDVALTAKSMYADGTPLRDIRATLEARYDGYPSTDTPVPA